MPRTSSLFETTVSAEELDPWFAEIRDDRDYLATREYVDNAWSELWHVFDPNFHDQFQRRSHFQRRAWELRLAWTLYTEGHVLAPNRSDGPDVTLLRDDKKIHFEAVTPDPDPDLTVNYEQALAGVTGLPEGEMIRRATGSIQSKRGQYCRRLRKGLVQEDEPYVIALSAGALPVGSMNKGLPWIVKPLFGLGELYFSVPVGGIGESHAGVFGQAERSTSTGSPIDAALFTDARVREVSALLFSSQRLGTFSAPNADDWLLIDNPYALNPLPRDILPRARERFSSLPIAKGIVEQRASSRASHEPPA